MSSLLKLSYVWLARFEQHSLISSCWHGRLNSYKGTALITWPISLERSLRCFHLSFLSLITQFASLCAENYREQCFSGYWKKTAVLFRRMSFHHTSSQVVLSVDGILQPVRVSWFTTEPNDPHRLTYLTTGWVFYKLVSLSCPLTFPLTTSSGAF